MVGLVIGVGNVTLHVRHSRSLKDKRKVMQSLVQKLRNEGFSVTEVAFADDPKRGSLGYAFAGNDPAIVRKRLEEAGRILIGDFLVVENKTDVFDYGGEDAFSDEAFRFPDDDDDDDDENWGR